jgi:hypothetical protein
MQTMELSFMGHRKHLTGNEKGPPLGGDDSSARKWELTTIPSMTYPSVSGSCDVFGGKEKFGFDPKKDIGNHSIQSGAAMALFLMDHHPTKIMILGRWKSEAFMDYIRPQVLEWTNLMSRDMLAFDSLTDLLEFGTMGRGGRSKLGRNSEGLSVPRLHLDH